MATPMSRKIGGDGYYSSKPAKEVSLEDDFGTAIVLARGIKIELNSKGGVDVYTNGPVQLHPAPHH